MLLLYSYCHQKLCIQMHKAIYATIPLVLCYYLTQIELTIRLDFHFILSGFSYASSTIAGTDKNNNILVELKHMHNDLS